MDKQALLLVIDCGLASIAQESPNEQLDSATSFASAAVSSVQAQLANLVLWGRKSDHAGVLAFTNETPVVLHPLGTPSRDSIREIGSTDELPQSTNESIDLLAASEHALGLLSRHCRKLKYSKSITILCTKTSLETTGWDGKDAHNVVKALDDYNVSVMLMVYPYELPAGFQVPAPFVVDEFVPADHRLHQPRPVRPIASYIGPLRIGHASAGTRCVTMNVKMFPAARKRAGNTASAVYGPQQMPVRQVYDYETEDEQLVDAKSMEPGYLYGSEIIPFTAELDALVKKERPALIGGLEIIGFFDMSSSAVPAPILAVDASDYVLAQDDESALKLSALARSLYEREVGALARLTQARKPEPALYWLEPAFVDGIEGLMARPMPYKQDIREFKQDFLVKDLPSETIARTKRVIDLMTTNEQLDYMGIPNPQIVRTELFIKAAALNGDSTIPEALTISVANKNSPALAEAMKALTAEFDLQPVLKPKSANAEESYLATEELNIDELF